MAMSAEAPCVKQVSLAQPPTLPDIVTRKCEPAESGLPLSAIYPFRMDVIDPEKRECAASVKCGR